MAKAPSSSAEFLDLLRRSGILSSERLAPLTAAALPPEAQNAAAALVARGLITKFQAQQLLAGRHKGFRLGSYAVQDILGRGGMGAVYLGEHVELHRKAAIKVLVPGKDDDQKLAVERFQREARAVAALDHPNIVRLFDVARHGETPFLVMEYVEGETLQQILDRDGPIPYATAVEYVAQAASGLQHAHEKGFIHRDIKPGNLMRDRSGTVKILDMGLARSSSTQDKLTEHLDKGAVVGTADFIAPEQGMNQPVDIRADIYSLGATFFSLVIGRPPFEGNTTQKLLQHQLKNAPTLASLDATLPAGLSVVATRMLAKRPADRYQTPAEVIAALAPWMGNSARIIAGLSRTNLVQGADLQATLAGINRAGGSLKTAADSAVGVGEMSDVDAAVASQETGAVATAVTTREVGRKTAPPPDGSLPNAPTVQAPVRRRSRRLVVAGIAVAVLTAGAVAGWLASGRNPKPAAPPEPVAGEPLLFQLDLAGQKPFVVRSGLAVDPLDPAKKSYKPVANSGDGAMPKNWQARCWNPATEMECFAREDGGKPAVGIRNVQGPGSAMLFTPVVDCPTGACRLTFEYQAAGGDKKFALKFKPNDSRRAWELAPLAATGTEWRREEVVVQMKGAVGGYFEFHNSDESPDASIRIRALAVHELRATAAPEEVLFDLDAGDLPAFKNAKEGRRKTRGDDDPRIKGVAFTAWKPETLSEWECGTFAGARAISVTNLNETVSAQVGVELESATGVGVRLEPGQVVRLRVVYRTGGKGRGTIYFQTPADQKTPARASLPASNDEWKTVDLIATRGANPFRLLVDTSEGGAGNTLYVRRITVTACVPEAVAATTPTPATDPNHPSQWAEGATAFKFTAAAVPEFRVQKERSVRISGDPEALPPGVGCMCWKEKAVGDFRCEKTGGVPALGLTNLNDELSAQFFFQLEGALKVALQPGKAYRMKVEYRTANEGAGTAAVQVTPGYKSLASAHLKNTGGAWATATASFTRPPAEDKVQVRLTIDNTTVGEGNTLWVRAVEVVELVPPAKK